MLSSSGELGHAVNENPRSGRGVVGDSRSIVNVEDAELDCELPGNSQKQSISGSGVLGLIGQTIAWIPRRTGGTDTRRGTLAFVSAGSSRESIAGHFGTGWVLPLTGFASPVLAALGFITDQGWRCYMEAEKVRGDGSFSAMAQAYYKGKTGLA